MDKSKKEPKEKIIIKVKVERTYNNYKVLKNLWIKNDYYVFIK
jgi:hypothetical protein